jgi:hypothetical protein
MVVPEKCGQCCKCALTSLLCVSPMWSLQLRFFSSWGHCPCLFTWGWIFWPHFQPTESSWGEWFCWRLLFTFLTSNIICFRPTWMWYLQIKEAIFHLYFPTPAVFWCFMHIATALYYDPNHGLGFTKEMLVDASKDSTVPGNFVFQCLRQLL